MPSPSRFGWDNRIDTAEIIASDSAGELVPEHLAEDDVNVIWRVEGSSGWILADFGALVPIGFTMLANTNLNGTSPVQVRLSTADASGGSGDAYNTGAIFAGVGPEKLFVHILPETVLGRYLRIDMTVTDPEAGRWAAGPAFTPGHNFSYGWEPLWRDRSRKTETIDGVVYSDRMPGKRGWRGSFRAMTFAEINAEVMAMNQRLGTSKDFLLCLNADSDDLGRDSLWGALEGEPPIRISHTNPKWFEASFEMWERI